MGKTDELIQIGLRLSNCRQNRNMTQEELAGRLGITPQAVSKWERSVSLPDISMLSDLARILGISADWLLGLDADRGNSDEAGKVRIEAHLLQQEMGSCLRNCLDPLELAFGEEIVPVFRDGSSFLSRIRDIKLELAKEGIWTPVIRIRDRLSLEKKEFQILSFNSVLYAETLDTVDAGTLDHMLGRLGEAIRGSYHEILYPDLVKDMVDNLKIRYPALIEGIVPERISYGLLTETMRIALSKGISACYLPKMIESMECALRRNPSARADELAECILEGQSARMGTS